MARKNRMSVYDGVYHVTTRIANRAMLLKPEAVKDRIKEWISSVAAFSGVEVWSWCIMDNHLHLFLHVPPVPERYWLDPKVEPAAYAFGMRPPECREPLWSPQGDCPPSSRPAGDCPPPPRPSLDFMLSDDEMLDRLRFLYGAKGADVVAKRWESLREHGNDVAVDEEKERYCRRMYNLSQYCKTLKERISMWYNEEFDHAGCLWQGRFHSAVVERSANVVAVVAAYIGYNPVKARIASAPERWRWSSYALAVTDGGDEGVHCRKMYERMLGRPWAEVRAVLESIYADKLPDDMSPEMLKELFDYYEKEDGDADNAGSDPSAAKFRASQAIRATMRFFSHGAYIGRDFAFLERVGALLPRKFPRAGRKSIKWCRAFSWELPPVRMAA